MKNSAFTLIELIIVIVLLGILAATALPRFVDFSGDAHLSRVKAYEGALKVGLKLYRNKWLTQGSPAAGTSIALDNNTSLNVNSYGYPAGNDGGSTITSNADCSAIAAGVLGSGVNVTTWTWGDNLSMYAGNDIAVRKSTTPGNQNCVIAYLGDNPTSGEPNYRAIILTSTGHVYIDRQP